MNTSASAAKKRLTDIVANPNCGLTKRYAAKADAARHITLIQATRKNSHMTDQEYREASLEGRD